MATLVLFQAPDCRQPGDAFTVVTVTDLEACVASVRSASAASVVVIGPEVEEADRAKVIDAVVERGGYFLEMDRNDTRTRVRRLVRAVLK